MHLRREKSGSLTIHLTGGDATFLRSLATDLRAHIEKPDFNKRVTNRLFPRCAEDPKVHRELQDMLLEDQRRQKLDRADAFVEALARVPAKGGDITLAPAELESWLALLTDLRFIYADAIGIEDDNWGRDIDPRRPPSREVAVYITLTNLQQALLDHGPGIDYDAGWIRPR